MAITQRRQFSCSWLRTNDTGTSISQGLRRDVARPFFYVEFVLIPTHNNQPIRLTFSLGLAGAARTVGIGMWNFIVSLACHRQ